MSTIMDFIMQRLVLLPGIIIGLSFHEFGHAFVSSRLGDPTPRIQGRVTLNPAAHVDLMGFVLLMLIGFGWGKPVQIDPRYYKHRRRDSIMVALAGVCMNLLLAFAAAGLMKLYYIGTSGVFSSSSPSYIVWQILEGVVQINIVLLFFNLLPLPPLDGFGIVTQIFKLDTHSWYPRFYQLGPMLLLLLIFFDLTQYIITPEVNLLYSMIMNLFFGSYGL